MLILVSTVTGCIRISEVASLVAIPVDITSSEVGIKFSAITAEIKKHKSMIKKKNKNHDKIILWGKSKLNTIKVQISKALINSYISHDELVSINDVWREYYEVKEEIENPETSVKYVIWKQWKPIVSVVKYLLLKKIEVSEKLNKID